MFAFKVTKLKTIRVTTEMKTSLRVGGVGGGVNKTKFKAGSPIDGAAAIFFSLSADYKPALQKVWWRFEI